MEKVSHRHITVFAVHRAIPFPYEIVLITRMDAKVIKKATAHNASEPKEIILKTVTCARQSKKENAVHKVGCSHNS